MKKVLSLTFVATVILLGCSADGFFNSNTEQVTAWSQMCKVGEICSPVSSKKQCDDMSGSLVTRSQCPK